MTVRLERRNGKIVVDINVRMANGIVRRERRAAPIQTETRALAWGKRRESFLITGREEAIRSGLKPRRNGCVYFLRDGHGAIKIGWATDVGARMSGLLTAHSTPLTLLASMPGTPRDEHELHKRFGHLRGQREWFRPDAELLDFIFSIGAGVEQVAPKSQSRESVPTEIRTLRPSSMVGGHRVN